MKVKIKKLHANATIPKYAKPGDAGMDLTATSFRVVFGSNGVNGVSYLEYGTGISIEIPEGYVGLVFPRSSISETCLILSNSVGVIDSGYRGEIKARFRYDGSGSTNAYASGERIAQLIIIPYPQIEFEEVQELQDSERGTGGYGSTGTK
jgi:dUTP pyrophosphatase